MADGAGFRLPAEAVRAGIRAARERDDGRLSPPSDTALMTAALSAALPVLAESPELVEHCARELNDRWAANPNFGAFWDSLEDVEREHMRAAVRTVFRAAASPTEGTEGGDAR
jgi:hypothetical protein